RCRTHARRATSARPPSGSKDSFRRLLTAWSPDVHLRTAFLLLGCPQLLARTRKINWNLLHAVGDGVERLPQAEIAAELLEPPAGTDAPDQIVGVALAVGLLLDEGLELLVGDLDLLAVGDRLEDELPLDGLFCLLAKALEDLLLR